jgi:hypothetical protein
MGAKLLKYGHGIVDKDGVTWWGEGCISRDPEPLADVVGFLNSIYNLTLTPDIRAPYRVVELWFEAEYGDPTATT